MKKKEKEKKKNKKTWTIRYLDGRALEVEAESFVKAVEKVKDKLGYADLRSADLRNVDLSGANLDYAYLKGAKGLPRLG